VTIPDREAGNRDCFTKCNKENTAGGVAINCEYVSACAVDCHALVHEQCAARERDRARDAGGVNRVTVVRNGERLAQRAGTAVVGIGNSDRVATRGECDCAKKRQ